MRLRILFKGIVTLTLNQQTELANQRILRMLPVCGRKGQMTQTTYRVEHQILRAGEQAEWWHGGQDMNLTINKARKRAMVVKSEKNIRAVRILAITTTETVVE